MMLRVSRRIMFAVPFCAAPSAISGLARAAEGDFSAFLAGVRHDAIARGIRASTVDAAFRNAQFLPRVVELDRKQPERTMTFTQYIAKVVTSVANIKTLPGCCNAGPSGHPRPVVYRAAQSRDTSDFPASGSPDRPVIFPRAA